MGCDIHAYVEKYDSNDRKWKVVPDPTRWDWGLDRNYALFGLLAGVRGGATPLKEPVGLPNDVSAKLYDEYGPDDHSASYYTLTELINFPWGRTINTRYGSEKVEDIDRSFTALVKFLEYNLANWSIKPENIRLVFWFDN